MLNQFSIRAKILTLVMGVVFCFICLNIASIKMLSGLKASTSEKNNVQSVQSSIVLLNALNQDIQFLILNSSSGSGIESEQSSQKITHQEASWNEFLKINENSEGNLQAAIDAYKSEYDKNITLIKDDSALDAAENILITMPTLYTKLESILKGKLDFELNKIRENSLELGNSIDEFNLFLMIASGLFLVVSTAVAFYVVNFLIRPIDRVQRTLSSISTNVLDNASSLKGNASVLEKESGSLSSNIDLTSDAIMNLKEAMDHSITLSNRSQQKSEESSKVAQNGKQMIQNLLGSMKNVDESNSSFATEMGNVSQKLSDIKEIINSISAKTTMINDIVFQTKLLSFNASVEAQRAGEAGKGFAVVAEEVGNLASASGEASAEIEQLLSSSIGEVDGIVNYTNETIERHISNSTEKIRDGLEKADKCDEVLNEIIHNVDEMKGMIQDVSSSANGQGRSISEVEKSVETLYKITESTQNISKETLDFSLSLNTDSEALKESAFDLRMAIRGKKSA